MATMATQNLSAEDIFDQVGPAYEAAFESEAQKSSVAWVIYQLKDKKPARILDVGSGSGKPVCSSFAAAGHHVRGIDVSSVMIEHARRAVPDAEFEQVSFLDYQVPDGSLDAVTVYLSMIANITQDQIRQALRKYHGWLRPGGIFVFATVAVDCNLVQTNWLGRPLLASSFSAEDLLAVVRQAGYTVSHTEEEVVVPKAVEAGLCEEAQVSPEPWIFVHATK